MFSLKALSRRRLLWIPTVAVPFVGGCLLYLREDIERAIAVSSLASSVAGNSTASNDHLQYIYLPAELTGRLLLNDGDVGSHGDAASQPTITDDGGSSHFISHQRRRRRSADREQQQLGTLGRSLRFFRRSSKSGGDSSSENNPLPTEPLETSLSFDNNEQDGDQMVFRTAKDLKALRLSQSSNLEAIISAALQPEASPAAFRRPLKTILTEDNKMLLRLPDISDNDHHHQHQNNNNNDSDNQNTDHPTQLVSFELDELMNHLLRTAHEMKDRGSECARLLTAQALVLFDDHHHHHHNYHHNIDLNDIFNSSSQRPKSSLVDFRRYQNLYFQAILENLLSSREHVARLLENGLLLLLHRLRELFPERPVANWISACLSAISVHEDLARRHLAQAGWIGVLVGWLQQTGAKDDLRLNLEAAKTLHNLAFSPAVTLSRSLYILHPIHHPPSHHHHLLLNNTSSSQPSPPPLPQPKFDIIFIHGLQGGVFKTWRQADAARKAAAGEPYSDAAFLAVNYQTFLSNWLVNCGQTPQTLRERSGQLAEELRAAAVGERPIIWVAHSMGGLLVKEMLCQIGELEGKGGDHQENLLPSTSGILEQTKGVVFFSVPNLGSEMAVWSPQMQRIISPSAQVLELRKDSATLKELNERFIRLSSDRTIDCLSFGEGVHSMLLRSPIEWKFLLVPEESANPGIGRFIVLPEDHFHICKPRDREATAYRELVNFIATLVGETESGKRKGAEELLPNDLLLSSCVI
ncbi:Serine active site containing protein 1 [Tyrophagus putrescentiae]|nr:Serine active site containing protein 1 [Tyrophagus putrescentiae]